MLKSMGEAHFRTPTPPKPLNRFLCHVKYITTSPQGVDVQNLVGIDSAVTDLRMREKTRFVWIFLSRVCAVALYAVLEANAKVNGRGPFSHPHPSETPQPISMSCQIYYYVPPGS